MKKYLITIAICLLFVGCVNQEENKAILEVNKYMVAGDFVQAIEKGEEFVAEYPDSYLGWNILGWSYLKGDYDDKAVKCFDKALSINENSDNAYVGKGVVHRKKGENKEAIENYEKAIAIEPENAEALSSILVVEIIEGNYEKAVKYGEKAWEIRKDLATIPANLSLAYHYVGNDEKRDEFYNHAKRLNYYQLNELKKLYK